MIIFELQRACPWLALTASQWQACEANHDVLDAVICALVARAVGLGATIAPTAAIARDAALESWIQLPDDTPVSELWIPMPAENASGGGSANPTAPT